VTTDHEATSDMTDYQ